MSFHDDTLEPGMLVMYVKVLNGWLVGADIFLCNLQFKMFTFDFANYSTMAITWTCKAFNQLTADSLYNILHARCSVFVLEQKCVWLEVDNLDQKCYHLIATSDDKCIAAYARLIPPQTKGPAQTLPVISRVLTTANYRGTGIGKQVMIRAIEECSRRWPKQGVLINAQAYLEPFYKSLGFVQISELYDEDGIMHMDMVRNP